jgi:DNA-binding response OmpR family regulator
MKKILIIEDDNFLRELIVKKLLREGFEVKEALDGEEGVKKTKEEKPDLVLLDLILPTFDGFEVLSRIKMDSETKEIPVVILSNLGQKDEIERGMAMGAADYLVKANFTPSEIVAKIKAILQRG